MGLPIKPRITISKTPTEWESINDKLKEVTKNDIKGYVNNEVQKLTKKYISDPNTILSGIKKTEIQFTIKHPTYLVLKEISSKMKKPINSIINELVILPLLSSKP